MKEENSVIRNELIELTESNIKEMIYEIRGHKVMLDFDLAKIYGYETKRFNEQVRNNIERFPERFMFQLNIEEVQNISWSKKSTLNKSNDKRGFNIKYLPYAFTEEGVYMLMTVLKGELAVKQSIALIDCFKTMKNYLATNNNLFKQTKDYIDYLFESYDKKFNLLMNNFVDTPSYNHFLLFEGQRIESDIAYQTLYKLARNSLIIIDDYINIKTLQLLKICRQSIKIIIFSDNKAKDNITDEILEDFKLDKKMDLSIYPSNNRFHDRYLFIDFNTSNFKVYHCGTSSKDAGSRIHTIVEIQDKEYYVEMLGKLLKAINDDYDGD